MQNLITKALSLLPNSISILPYRFAFFFVRFLAKQHNLLCWSRNSYQHNRIIPGLSDIDFTILYSGQNSSSQLKKFLNIYAQAKSFMPILGEINIYQQEALHLTEKWTNPYELNRDPLLKRFISPRPKEPFSRFCYLLRMLESDAKNLRFQPNSRLKKWNYHFAEVELPQENELLLTGLIASISSLNTTAFTVDEISGFLNRFIKDGPHATYTFYRSNKAIKIFMVLFPHRWLVIANGINDVDICLNANQFNSDEIHLVLEQIYWELAGIQAQVGAHANNKTSIAYLDLMLNFLNNLKTLKIEEIIPTITYDIELQIRNIKNHC